MSATVLLLLGVILSASPAFAQDPAAAPAAPALDTGDTAFVLISAALVLLMTIPGLALFYGGMVRTKNILGTLAQSFVGTMPGIGLINLYGPTETTINSSSYVVDPAELNFAWDSKGASQLLPQRIYDDGNATFLTWPAGTAMPAILIKDHKGDEGPVNYAVRGDTIVVEGVPRELVLRTGENSATLTNRGPVRPPRSQQAALAQAGQPNAEAK